MMRIRRPFVLIIAGVAGLLVFAVIGLYFALRHEPAFYRAALETDAAVLEKGSDRMLQQAAALEGAVTRQGRWRAVITVDEINGWLAVDLVKNHPKMLPPTLRDPRVSITAKEVRIGCRYEQSGMLIVLSLTLQPYLSEPNVVAFRIVRARAGAIPLPLEQIVERFSQAARDLRLRFDRRQAGGDPVARIWLPDDADADRVVRIESLQVVEGKIRVAGTTERRK